MGMVRVSDAPSAPSAKAKRARRKSTPHSSSNRRSGTPVYSEQDKRPWVYCTVGTVARARSVPVLPLHSMK